MIVSLQLPMRTISINATYSRDMRFKTSEYRAWATEFLNRIEQLDEYKSLLELGQIHKERGGIFSVSVIIEYPQHIFYNKDGAISSKTIDMSNGTKGLIDLLFGQVMETNDKHIVRLVEEKKAAGTYGLRIKIELLPMT